MEANKALALTYLGISPDDFWWLTPREFSEAMEVVRNKHTNQQQHDYELARFTAYLNPQLDRTKVGSPEDLISFRWEPDHEKRATTQRLNDAELFKLRAMAWGKEKAQEMAEADRAKSISKKVNQEI
ncbi:MAG: phage tail assembly chaperone [Roseivirga sp.]|nr:phage tail assembly chaperone [Roseivirga sp.]